VRQKIDGGIVVKPIEKVEAEDVLVIRQDELVL
jgi:hypothetical protein